MNEKKILVIEDEDDIAYLIKFSLHKMGYNVMVANSGPEGINRAQSVKFDLITVDINMPCMSGMEILEKLKCGDINRETPVVMISGAEYKYRNECLEAGAETFFSKPLNFEKFNEKIKSIIENKA